MSKHSLSSYIKDYFIPMMDIPVDENVKNNFLNAIDKKNRKDVELWYPEILKTAIISGDHNQCKIHFNRMRFDINAEIGTTFPFVYDTEFS
jgi:hypothetical protein